MNESKFDGMGEIYAKFRPTYPQEFIEYLYSDVGISKHSTIADIGSGTGILTKQLLEAGNKVFSVEPNDDMRAIAEVNLRCFNNYISVNGTAEHTTLCNESINFITVAQVFHWFDRVRFKAECSRILKLNGIIILVWNSRVFDSEVVKDVDKTNRKYCPNFKGFSGDMRGAEGENDFDDFFVGEYESKVFYNDQVADLDGFIGRNLSASYALKENDEDYPAYVAELTANFNKYAIDGNLVMPVITRSYVGKI